VWLDIVKRLAPKYHIAFCPKYWRPVLVDAAAARLEELLRAKAAELEMGIHALEIMPDHVHLFVESDPRWAVAEVINRMKSSISHALRQEFPHLRSCLPMRWRRSYYAGTVGHVSEATVRAYIEAQKAP